MTIVNAFPAPPPGRHTIASLVAVSWVVDTYFAEPILPGRFPPLVKIIVDELAEGVLTQEFLNGLGLAEQSDVPIGQHDSSTYKTLGDFLVKPSGLSWGITASRVGVGDDHVLQGIVDSTWLDIIRPKATRFVLNRLLRIAHDGVSAAPGPVAKFLSAFESDDQFFYFVRDSCYPAASPKHTFRAENAMIDCVSPLDTRLSIRHFRPGYQFEPRLHQGDLLKFPGPRDLKEPLQSLASIARLAVDPEGLRFISALSNDHDLLRRSSGLKVDGQLRYLSMNIQKWLRQISDDPRYDSLLCRLYLALDTPGLARGTRSYVAMFRPGLQTLGFSSYNWAFFMAHALSGEYEKGDKPVHVLFRKASSESSSEMLSGTVFGVTIHGHGFIDLDAESIIAIGRTDTRTGTSNFAHQNMQFVRAMDKIPSIF